eukprot:TRINITY_DN7291_c0_g1_i1.p2 TRINITY_DN7291_c0_g1~~TRINITY_DN7291_c0_g1_i1.p2  ORF type:complete len:440 (-),score=97.78 TRINITY_DN7291_c0_g1_i1:1427-2746(-)
MEKMFVSLPHERENWNEIAALLQETPEMNTPAQFKALISKISPSRRKCNLFNGNPKVYSIIRELVLEAPTLFKEPLPCLEIGQQGTTILSRKQAASLLSCSYLGLFRRSEKDFHSARDFPLFDLTLLENPEFIKCLNCYFERIQRAMPEGFIKIERKVLPPRGYPHLPSSAAPICHVRVTTDSIEGFTSDRLHADFANQFIGGGVLEGGCVQEEILFVIKPECLVSMLICERMEPNEAILITGAEQFSGYSGYGLTMKFSGPHENTIPTFVEDDKVFIKNTLVGIDAIVARRNDQYEMIDRDIIKVYAGLVNENKTEKRENFVTGNWGCGVFGGDKELKTVQQMIACSEAQVDMIYSSFHDEQFKRRLEHFVDQLHKKKYTVGDLYRSLKSFPSSNQSSVFDYIQDSRSPTTRYNLFGCFVLVVLGIILYFQSQEDRGE